MAKDDIWVATTETSCPTQMMVKPTNPLGALEIKGDLFSIFDNGHTGKGRNSGECGSFFDLLQLVMVGQDGLGIPDRADEVTCQTDRG